MEHSGRQRKEVPSRELAFKVKRKEALAVHLLSDSRHQLLKSLQSNRT
ncbi:hypothetical protein M6B38_100015 [Iris pallida]|uniref:Uncharacterized protein n=1 Tax=Iris pallida TaxID=29817 RepID=A0AAX6IS67_IRIPA|nr:hypothetical protein M6B38_100015 [Iris pallida]